MYLQNRREKRAEAFKRAEKYIKEYRIKERDEIRLHREARKHNNFYVPSEPKLAFVIRIRGLVWNDWFYSIPEIDFRAIPFEKLVVGVSGAHLKKCHGVVWE